MFNLLTVSEEGLGVGLAPAWLTIEVLRVLVGIELAGRDGFVCLVVVSGTVFLTLNRKSSCFLKKFKKIKSHLFF